MQANGVFVSDITYVESAEGALFITTDAYTRQIKGYDYRMICVTENVMQALHMAMQHVTDRTRMIHHSDRGSQRSELYQSALRHYGICPSNRWILRNSVSHIKCISRAD